MKSSILACIVNHNFNENARKLRVLFSNDFETIVLDSGSNKKDPSFILMDNVFYSGLFNRAVEETRSRNKEWLFFICSDVVVEDEEYCKISKRMESRELFENIGVYSPSSFGRSHDFCKNKETQSLRDVPMIEGFVFMARLNLLERMYPVDLSINKIGWGLDAMKGYLCYQSGKRCVIDDFIKVYHPLEAGYGYEDAINQMKKYIESREPDFKNYIINKIGFGI